MISIVRQIASLDAAASILRAGRSSPATKAQRDLLADDLAAAKKTLTWLRDNEGAIRAAVEASKTKAVE